MGFFAEERAEHNSYSRKEQRQYSRKRVKQESPHSTQRKLHEHSHALRKPHKLCSVFFVLIDSVLYGYTHKQEIQHGTKCRDKIAEKNIELYETIGNSLKDRYKGNQFVQYVEEKLRTTIGAGRTAPEIEMKDPNGVTRKLSDLRGKVVMIDFWASWCSPCRAENPNVVRLYKKYHDKGFEIYSVSLDKTRDAWLRAIQQDGLEWTNHVSDLNGWTSSGGATYGIRSVPSTVLVDRDGKIIARNLRGQELANKLK